MSPRRIRWLLAPLLIWAAHFFLGYGAALALPTSSLLDPLIVVLTVVAIGGLAWVWRSTSGFGQHRTVGRQATAIAALAVSWQGLVALF